MIDGSDGRKNSKRASREASFLFFSGNFSKVIVGFEGFRLPSGDPEETLVTESYRILTSGTSITPEQGNSFSISFRGKFRSFALKRPKMRREPGGETGKKRNSPALL